MILSRSFLRVLPSLPLLALVACAAPSDPSGSEEVDTSESAKRVDPVDTDAPGSVVVTAPPGADPNAYRVKVGERTVSFGQPVTGLAVGRVVVEVRTTSGAYLHSKVVDIASNATTTVPTGSFKLVTTDPALVVGINNVPGDSGCVSIRQMPTSLGCLRPDPAFTYVTFGADLHMTFGVADGLDARVDTGVARTIDLADRSTRRFVALEAPVDRELPNIDGLGNALITCTGGESSGARIVLPKGKTLHVGEASWNRDRVSCTFTIAQGDHRGTAGIPTRSFAFSGPVGAAPATAIPVGRLDIGHARLSSPDGSVREAVGRVSVFPLTIAADGTESPGPQLYSGYWFATNHGIDVFNGAYRVNVTYTTTEDGALAPRTQSFRVDVP